MHRITLTAVALIAILALPRGANADEWTGFQTVLVAEGNFDLDGPHKQVAELRANAALFLVPEHGVLEFFFYAGPKFHLATEKFGLWISPQFVAVGKAMPMPYRDQFGPSIWVKVVPTEYIALFIQGDLWFSRSPPTSQIGNRGPTYYGFYAVTIQNFWKVPVAFGAVVEQVDATATFGPKVDLVTGPLEISLQWHVGLPQPTWGRDDTTHTIRAVVLVWWGP